MPTLSPDFESARFCPILGLAQKVKKSLNPVIDLGIGTPSFLPAQHIVQAAISAAQENTGGYGSSRGDEALLAAYLSYLCECSFTNYTKQNLVAGFGAKHLLFSTLRVIIRPGDKILVPTPCWPTYFDIADLVGAAVIKVSCSAQTHFKMSAQALEKALSDKVRAVLLNSPGNPTGAVYSTEELASLAEILRRKDVWIISDDVYQRFVFDNHNCPHLLSVAPDLSDRIIKIDSVSKLYGMPGWRVGLLAADQKIAAAVTSLNSNSVSNIPPIAAAAAAAAFSGDQAFSYAARNRLLIQRQSLLADLSNAPYIKLAKPSGGFYLFIDISKTIGKSFQGRLITDDEEFCSILLDECSVALIPGSFFDAPGHARLSYSGTTEQVDAGVSRLKEFLSALS